MTTIQVKRAIENVATITSPQTKKEVFLIIASFNLLNAAVKKTEFRTLVNYGFIKPRVTRLFEYLAENISLRLIDALHYSPKEQCLYFRIYGLQMSFHDIIGNHPTLRAFAKSEEDTPMEWTGIRLQPVAERIFNLATDFHSGKLADLSGEVVKILNDSRKLGKRQKTKWQKITSNKSDN